MMEVIVLEDLTLNRFARVGSRVPIFGADLGDGKPFEVGDGFGFTHLMEDRIVMIGFDQRPKFAR